MKLKALLLDLDGTLIDTAPDMVATLNRLLSRYQQPQVKFESAAKLVSQGANALIKHGFGDDLPLQELDALRQSYLEDYAKHICQHSQLYEGMAEALSLCESNNILWGIVTNKPYYLAEALLLELKLLDRSSILLGGDSLPERKPHPMPLLHCCLELNLAASECLYVGDDQRDITAGNAAGMDTAAAQWGYINNIKDTETWGANYLIGTPVGLNTLIQETLA